MFNYDTEDVQVTKFSPQQVKDSVLKQATNAVSGSLVGMDINPDPTDPDPISAPNATGIRGFFRVRVGERGRL